MARALPARPDIEWLRKTAKQSLAALRVRDPQARLADAQRALARDHGFSSWRALKAHVDSRRGVPAFAGTALHGAAWEGNLELAKVLVAAGADVGALDREYRGTPAQFARVAVDVTNNPKCAAVAEYLESLSTDGAGRQQG